VTSPDNLAQVEYWNAAAGQTWANLQDLLDHQLTPLGLEAMAALAPAAGDRVLDIGCGCGQTTLELGLRVGPAGSVTGVDISQPMLAVARNRAAAEGRSNVVFQEADAQADIETLRDAAFDSAFSRFGVMFFSDPTAAFRNIRRALKIGGRLTFVCWRPLSENWWMRGPLEAGLPFVPPPEPADPDAPGPFAFCNPERVRTILHDAGFDAIGIRSFDTKIGAGDLERALRMALRVGPLAALVRDNPQSARLISEAVRGWLERHVTPKGVLTPAAVWIVTAQNM